MSVTQTKRPNSEGSCTWWETRIQNAFVAVASVGIVSLFVELVSVPFSFRLKLFWNSCMSFVTDRDGAPSARGCLVARFLLLYRSSWCGQCHRGIPMTAGPPTLRWHT